MVSPFENDTTAITKKLATRYLRSDKKSNLLIILTIAISVCMVLAIALSTEGIKQQSKNAQKDKAQITIIDATDEQLDMLHQNPSIEWIGESSPIGLSYQGNVKLAVDYVDNNYLLMQQKAQLTGDMPRGMDEIMLSQSHTEYLGQAYEIGDTIVLDLTGMGEEKEYRISGIVFDEAMDEGSAIHVYVSKELARDLGSASSYGTPKLVLHIRLNTQAIYPNEILNIAYQAVTPIGVAEGQVFLTDYFVYMTGVISSGLPISISLIAFITAILAAVVVYGIFYTMIVKNVKSIGQLRTLGMTKRQVKKMIRKESCEFALKGILLGIIGGIVIGFAVCPDGFMIKTAAVYSLLAAAVSIFVILIAIGKPIRIAMSITPLEGSKFFSDSGSKKVSQKLSRKLTVSNLARINISRNRKKAAFTFLTLGVSGVLFLTAATIASSIDAEKEARFKYYPYGDIHITLQNFAKSTFVANNEYNYSTRMQLENNPLEREELLQQFTTMEGVVSVTSHNSVYMKVQFPDGFMLGNDNPIVERQQFEDICKILSSGQPDYDEMTAQNGVIVVDDVGKLGDILTLELRGTDGNALSVEALIVGEYNKTSLMEAFPMVPGNPNIMITYDSIKKLTGVKNQTGVLAIQVATGSFDTVLSAIKEIADSSDEIECYDISETIIGIQQYYDSTIKNLYLISVILFMLGGISLANTLLVDFRNRKREFGLLRAVGATQGQLKTILQKEIAFYLMGSLIISFLGGTLLSSVICKRLDVVNHCITYRYPWFFAIGLVVMLALIQFVFSWYSGKESNKTNILDAVRTQSG